MESLDRIYQELKRINNHLQLLELKIDALREYMIQNDIRNIKL